MTAVKICGLTRKADVELALELGAAYLGFNFAAGSPRRVAVETAAKIAPAGGRTARRVGVFVDETADEIRRAIDAGSLDLLQFHRTVRAEDFRYGIPVVGVVSVAGGGGAVRLPRFAKRCHALLLDTLVAGRPGGTGRRFDWRRARNSARRLRTPLWVAGGLSAENVGEAIRCLQPAAVDVASGVESSPGMKDRARLTAFFEAVGRADEDRE